MGFVNAEVQGEGEKCWHIEEKFITFWQFTALFSEECEKIVILIMF